MRCNIKELFILNYLLFCFLSLQIVYCIGVNVLKVNFRENLYFYFNVIFFTKTFHKAIFSPFLAIIGTLKYVEYPGNSNFSRVTFNSIQVMKMTMRKELNKKIKHTFIETRLF